MRIRLFLQLPIFLWGLAGCSAMRPTLHATAVEAVPLPMSMIESQLWQKAKPVRVKLTQTSGQSISAEVRAIHDGRTISFLIAWPDQTESLITKAWVRNKPGDPWHTEEVLNDRLWLMFPLTKSASFDIYRGPDAQYDVWQWQAAWSNVSGYADDGRLVVKYRPGPNPPQDAESVVYPSADGKGYVEQLWRDDGGGPGTIAQNQPKPTEVHSVVPAGIANPYAGGGAIDVRAIGSYSRQDLNSTTTFWNSRGERTPGYWFGESPTEERPGSYFVKFHRLLRTASDEEDYQLSGPGPHPFAVAVIDNRAGNQPFISKPLELVIEKAN